MSIIRYIYRSSAEEAYDQKGTWEKTDDDDECDFCRICKETFELLCHRVNFGISRTFEGKEMDLLPLKQIVLYREPLLCRSTRLISLFHLREKQNGEASFSILAQSVLELGVPSFCKICPFQYESLEDKYNFI